MKQYPAAQIRNVALAGHGGSGKTAAGEAIIETARRELYEETKHMTASEHTRWSNDRAQKLAAQFGFKIGKPRDRVKADDS